MTMKQDAKKLLPGTIIVNSDNEAGTLVRLTYLEDNKPYWLINWTGRGLDWLSIDKVQECVIL